MVTVCVRVCVCVEKIVDLYVFSSAHKLVLPLCM